jgi:hypothetical protein
MSTPYFVIFDFKSDSSVMGKGGSFVFVSNMQVLIQLTAAIAWVGISQQFQEFGPYCPHSTAANSCLWLVWITHIKLTSIFIPRREGGSRKGEQREGKDEGRGLDNRVIFDSFSVTHTHKHMHTYTHAYVYAHTGIHAYTHAHAPPLPWNIRNESNDSTLLAMESLAPECNPNPRLSVLQGRCSRENCKYLHPPTHLKTQLEINGRNNLIQQKTAAAMLAQQMQFMFPGTPLHPVVSVPFLRVEWVTAGLVRAEPW